MDGMADVSARISQITAQLAALSSGGPAARPPAGTASTTGTTGTTGSAGSSTTAGASSGPFGSVLADALNNQLSTLAASTGDGTSDGTSDGGLGSGAGSSTGGASADPSASAALVAARMALTGLPTAAATPGASAAAPTTAAAPSPVHAARPAAAAKPAASYPTDLSAYGNGRIPASALKPLGVGDHRLWAPAADHFRAMRAAAARDGVSIGVNDSYRSYAEQVDMARRKGLYSQGGLAAAPGTSEHGLGKSVDLQLDSRALSWMRAHADEYGFRNNVPRESWHWTYTARS